MKNLNKILCSLLLMLSSNVYAQKIKTYQLSSPGGNIILKIEVGEKLQWSVLYNSSVVILPSAISMQLQSGEVPGNKAVITSVKNKYNDQSY